MNTQSTNAALVSGSTITNRTTNLFPERAAENPGAFTPGGGNTHTEKAGTLQSSPPPRPTQCNLPIQGGTAADNPPGVATCSAWYDIIVRPTPGTDNTIDRIAPALARAAAPEHLCDNHRALIPWKNGVRRVIAVHAADWKLVSRSSLLQLMIAFASSAPGDKHMWNLVVDDPAVLAGLSAGSQQLPPNLFILLRVGKGTESELRDIRSLAKAFPSNNGILMEPTIGCCTSTLDLAGIGWVIMGGDVRGTVMGNRPFQVEWARDLAAHCADHGVPFFLNRLGSYPTKNGTKVELKDPHGEDWKEWPPEAPRQRGFPRSFKLGPAENPAAEKNTSSAPAAPVNGPEVARVKQDRAGASAGKEDASMEMAPPQDAPQAPPPPHAPVTEAVPQPTPPPQAPPPQGPVMAKETKPTVKPAEPAEDDDEIPATEKPLPAGDEDTEGVCQNPNMSAPPDDVPPTVDPGPGESPDITSAVDETADDVADGTETSPSTEDDDAATKVPEAAGTDVVVEPEPDVNPSIKPTDDLVLVPDEKPVPPNPVKTKGKTITRNVKAATNPSSRRAAQGSRKKVVKDKSAGENGEKGTSTGATEDAGQRCEVEPPSPEAGAGTHLSPVVDNTTDVEGLPSAKPGQRASGTKGSKQHAPPVPDQVDVGEPTNELARFKELDAVVRGSREAFVEMGLALNEIHALELWKAGRYKSFEKYAREVLHKSKQEVHRLIDAACFHKLLREKPSPIGDDLPLPTHPSQVRPLDKSLDGDSKVQVWTEACKACGKGKVPTAPDVQKQKDRLFPKPKSETGTDTPDSKTQKPNRRSMTETYPELVPLFTAIRSGELEEANLLLEQIAGRHGIKLDGDTPDEPEDDAGKQST